MATRHYPIDGTIADLERVATSAEHTVGETCLTNLGGKAIYVKASGEIVQFDAVSIRVLGSAASGNAMSAIALTTALGAIAHYVSHANPVNYQPTNIAFGLFPPLEKPPRKKRARRQALAQRALADLTTWQSHVSAEVSTQDETTARVVS